MQNTLSQANIQKYFEIQVFRKLKKKYKKKPATEFILGKVAEHKTRALLKLVSTMDVFKCFPNS